MDTLNSKKEKEGDLLRKYGKSIPKMEIDDWVLTESFLKREKL